jgi:hypothetical protein
MCQICGEKNANALIVCYLYASSRFFRFQYHCKDKRCPCNNVKLFFIGSILDISEIFRYCHTDMQDGKIPFLGVFEVFPDSIGKWSEMKMALHDRKGISASLLW